MKGDRSPKLNTAQMLIYNCSSTIFIVEQTYSNFEIIVYLYILILILTQTFKNEKTNRFIWFFIPSHWN